MLEKKTIHHIFFKFFWIVVLLVVFSSAIFATPQDAGDIPDHVTLTWAGDPQTTQTITWRSNVTIVSGLVQYGEAIAGEAFPGNSITVAAAVAPLSTNLGDMNIHSVTLTGLKPGTRYLYRVGNESGWSEPSAFTTPAVNNSGFKFLVFGDSQSINYDVWRITLHQAYQANPEAVFFINVGDLVDVGQDYAQWDAWFAAIQGVSDIIPIMPLTGNHEAYTPQRQFSMPLFFTAQFKLPSNGPDGLRGQVYSFDYKDVHFIMLDSQESEEERFVPAMLERQKIWLEKDLAATDKKWKVVFIHRPPYNNKATDDGNNIRRTFVPILDKYHADIVFTGHDHVYARTYPLRSNAVVANPSQGTIYVATGRSGTKIYKDTLARNWNEFFYNPLDEPNYITVELQGNMLTVKALTQSGSLIDTWTIDKAF